jgi:hypothetical protein
MKFVQLFSGIVAITTALLGFVPACYAQSTSPTSASAHSPDHKDTVTVTLKTIKALTQAGSPEPEHDKDCRAKFGNLILQSVTTTYNINTETMVMSANSTFQGKRYDLNSLGIAGKYAFGVFRPSSNLPVYAVLFQISTQFTNPSSELNLNWSNQFNCLVSSK